MKISNKLLLLAIASAVVPMSITPTERNSTRWGGTVATSAMNYGLNTPNATGTAVAESEPSAQFRLAAAAHQKFTAKSTMLSSKIPVAKDAEKAADGKLKGKLRTHRLSLEKAEKTTKKATTSLQQDADRITKKIEKLQKQLKSDLAAIAKARDERDLEKSKDKEYEKAPDAGFKKYNSQSNSMGSDSKSVLVGGSPSTWSPVITFNPSTGYTYIQTYDKNGKLGSKEVYRKPGR